MNEKINWKKELEEMGFQLGMLLKNMRKFLNPE
jgi:hypothetical protein